MSELLGDFFKLIAEDKRIIAEDKKLAEEAEEKVKEEFKSKYGEVDEQFKDIFGEVNIDSVFDQIKLPVLEQQDKSQRQAQAFGSWLEAGSDEERQELIESSAEDFREQVENVLDPEINIRDDVVSRSVKVLDKITEEQQDPLNNTQFVTIDELKNHYRTFLDRVQVQLASLGGGGEVRLEFLDDVDRDSATVNGKFLKYDSSTGKWVGATASGGGGGSYSGTEGQLLQHDGNDFVGIASTALSEYHNDYKQGYHRFSTHYYSSGIANTSQTLYADEWKMLEPYVRTEKNFMPQVMVDANGGNPYVGSGATIGTGQTEFSLAGLGSDSTIIVRIATAFNPDVDYTNVDFSLNFTTNQETQGYGTTNFSIIREQALICNEGADQSYISETLMNFYVGSSLSGVSTQNSGSFNISAKASEEGEIEVMAVTVNVVA